MRFVCAWSTNVTPPGNAACALVSSLAAFRKSVAAAGWSGATKSASRFSPDTAVPASVRASLTLGTLSAAISPCMTVTTGSAVSESSPVSMQAMLDPGDAAVGDDGVVDGLGAATVAVGATEAVAAGVEAAGVALAAGVAEVAVQATRAADAVRIIANTIWRRTGTTHSLLRQRPAPIGCEFEDMARTRIRGSVVGPLLCRLDDTSRRASAEAGAQP